jgi:hypothetical protein
MSLRELRADRTATPDDHKLSFLGFGPWNRLNPCGPPDDVSARLAERPEAYRRIVVTFTFQAEMLPGDAGDGALQPAMIRMAREAVILPD